MKRRNKIVKMILQVLLLTLVGGYFTSSLIQSTFATNIDKSPNVLVTIGSDGKITQDRDLFDGQLYPATVKDAEKGIGGISGVIRISNQFKSIKVENIAIGIRRMDINNGYEKEVVYKSFLRDINLKIEKGELFTFNKTLVNYKSLEDILYDPDSEEYRGYILEPSDRFSIEKGATVDLKYTLHMVPEAGNELEAVTAYMPIYINLMENITDDDPEDPNDDDDDHDEEEIIDEEVPLAALNKEDHIQYIQGYPDNTVRPEGLITREEVAAVFYRLLDAGYRTSIWTQSEDFPDVDSNRWSVRHIATLANGNIINGYPDGSFEPGKYITRAELATIASKFDRLNPSSSNKFSDIDGHWADSYINSSALKGWVNGYPDGSFKPDQYITRAEFVTLVNNVLERKVHKENILPEAKKFPDLPDTMWYYEAMMEAINSHHYTRLEDKSELWIEIYYPILDM
ncbi:S-layer homology domain-containing protein [Tissierella sp. Yu-01]|uniref:S-layer homology domain-containing protein n=1 Tax=Tissierella sp. Yu-01 TaxID=3035694 RepID=UPI00240E119F|nr:S-layer homology domain-containing protein [Tissierella sp. Yu-01]WFA08267.1 S-layer homology domain-containing protein [Tissierella sp. Yu-01]